jgi:hypothetical protein
LAAMFRKAKAANSSTGKDSRCLSNVLFLFQSFAIDIYDCEDKIYDVSTVQYL